jgi:sugar lactone lactonase YvrE
VANGNNTVTVYARGSTSPSATYSDGLSRPLYPIVDSSGDLWVSNANNGTVVEYQPGSTSVYQVLHTLGNEADGMDFDEQGNLYVAYRTPSADSIEKFAHGSAQGKSLGMSLNQPQGVIVDNIGNILTVETGGTNRIDLFHPGAQTPSVEVPVPSTPTQIATRNAEKEHGFVISSFGEYSSYGYGSPVYAVHSLLSKPPPLIVKEMTQDLIQGVALSNGQTF